MKTLAWDTSTAVTAVALRDGDRTLASDASATETRHGETLLPRITALLGQAGWHKREVALIVVGVGPGSFTGLRVGLAAAKGWALATGVPLVGVGSHAAIAGPVLAETGAPVAVITDAFKGEVYVSVFDASSHGPGASPEAPDVTPFHAEPAVAAARLAALCQSREGQPLGLVGDGLRRYPGPFEDIAGGGVRVLPERCDVPSPVALAELGQARYHSQGASDLRTLEPLYVRGSDAQLPRTPLALDG